MEFYGLKRSTISGKSLLLLVFTFLSFMVMGYHPGAEDDGVYLTAIKADLRPALYPHDSDFFHLQLQATLFDRWMARFVDISHLSVGWSEAAWQILSLLVILWAVQRIAQQFFLERHAQWAGVAMVGAMFTLPVSGTALVIVDQHLHPRTVATALVLVAITRILDGKRWQVPPFLLLALLIHPIMAALGISFCFFLWLSETGLGAGRLQRWGGSAAAAAPLGWIFQPPSATWREALSTRTYYFLYKWTWYEWLGVIGPLLLFWLLRRFAQREKNEPLVRFASAVLLYGVFQQLVAMVMLTPTSLIRLTPLQPMRYLQLIYLFMALFAGCLIGRYMLRTRVWRWAVFLLLINGGMFITQRQLFAGTPHLEMPWTKPANPWLQAFAWIRENTPADAYFVLDPNYMAVPGEDYHSFRALAERSQLPDAIKDAAVVTQVPQLGPAWARAQSAQAGWDHFQVADFERLKEQFGVNWALVENRQTDGLDCQWHNQELSVCRIP